MDISMKSVRRTLEVLPAETRRHCMRTAVYTLALATAVPELQLIAPNKEIYFIRDAIYDGGLFHDIGKFMYSRQLLQSPNHLSETEKMIIRTHPVRAYEILTEDEGFQVADEDYKAIVSNCCLYHHEHYDGTGYPDGLKGDEIPIEAQIVSACDVLDALSSSRPYKKTLAFEQAYEILMNDGQKQFSPTILCALERMKFELKDIYKNRRLTYSGEILK